MYQGYLLGMKYWPNVIASVTSMSIFIATVLSHLEWNKFNWFLPDITSIVYSNTVYYLWIASMIPLYIIYIIVSFWAFWKCIEKIMCVMTVKMNKGNIWFDPYATGWVTLLACGKMCMLTVSTEKRAWIFCYTLSYQSLSSFTLSTMETIFL